MKIPLNESASPLVIFLMLVVSGSVLFIMMQNRRYRRKILTAPKDSTLIAIRNQFNNSEITHDQYEQKKYQLIKKHLCLPRDPSIIKLATD